MPAKTPDPTDRLASFVERWCPNATRREFAGELQALVNSGTAGMDAHIAATSLGIRMSVAADCLKAVQIAVQYGGIDGEHHKNWVIDQMVRVLTGDDYDRVVREACVGDDGADTFKWDVGVAP